MRRVWRVKLPTSHPGVQYSLLAATELTDGVFYPIGGFGTIGRALLQICAEAGVTVRTSSAVKEITIDREGHVSGVKLAGAM